MPGTVRAGAAINTTEQNVARLLNDRPDKPVQYARRQGGPAPAARDPPHRPRSLFTEEHSWFLL